MNGEKMSESILKAYFPIVDGLEFIKQIRNMEIAKIDQEELKISIIVENIKNNKKYKNGINNYRVNEYIYYINDKKIDEVKQLKLNLSTVNVKKENIFNLIKKTIELYSLNKITPPNIWIKLSKNTFILANDKSYNRRILIDPKRQTERSIIVNKHPHLTKIVKIVE